MKLPKVEVIDYKREMTTWRVRMELLREWYREAEKSGDKAAVTLIQRAIADHRRAMPPYSGKAEAEARYAARLAQYRAQRAVDPDVEARFIELDRLMRQRRAVELV